MTRDDVADRVTITDLISRYFGAVDDKCLDTAIVEATFTADGRLVRPNGSAMVGRQEILAGQTESFARFRATHHVSTDHLVRVDGDRARIRANLTAMHLWADERAIPARSRPTSSPVASFGRSGSAPRKGGA